MELKGRLKLIADKVPRCHTVGDVGTDHAFIPIYLIQKGICKKAVAADIKEGPVNTAKKNIQSHGLDELIETRMGSGLQPLGMGECDTVVIAGMGGLLIRNILSEEYKKACATGTLVLQPMYAVEALRQWLYAEGFEIYDEELEAEDDKVYVVLCSRYTGVRVARKELDCIIGEKLIEKQDPLLAKYLDKKISQTVKVIYEIRNSSKYTGEILEKNMKVLELLSRLLNAIK
ncbi:MAG: class I SAM-dependent methyltransferase [Clostridia bacterium]|nr:class I SAM-dependent methyltransferase [Clostridia bacterium]